MDTTRCSDAEPASPTAPSVATVCVNPICPVWGQGTHWHPSDQIGTEFVLGFPSKLPPTGPVNPGSAPNTDAPRQNDIGTASDNYFQQIHQSDKGIAERERGWDRGEE